MYLINFIRGFFMALADSVPGVSGGTIAFILGFYDELINSINSLISGNKEERFKALSFLFKIGIGWVIGIVLAIFFITSVFEEHIYLISSLFIGLIIMAIPLIIKEEKDVIIDNKINILFTILGIIVVASITYFNPLTQSGDGAVSLTDLNFGLILFIFIAGMIAISAMVLPGISGSTILLILGLYGVILNAIKEVLTFNFTYFPVVFIFGLGIITGVLLTIKVVKYALKNYRSQTIYLILGFMISSIYAVIMGPMSLEIPKEQMNFSTFNLLYFLIGILIIFGLEKLKKIF